MAEHKLLQIGGSQANLGVVIGITFKDIFIYVEGRILPREEEEKEEEGRGQRENFLLPIHSPDGCNFWSYASAKLAAWP